MRSGTLIEGAVVDVWDITGTAANREALLSDPALSIVAYQLPTEDGRVDTRVYVDTLYGTINAGATDAIVRLSGFVMVLPDTVVAAIVNFGNVLDGLETETAVEEEPLLFLAASFDRQALDMLIAVGQSSRADWDIQYSVGVDGDSFRLVVGATGAVLGTWRYGQRVEITRDWEVRVS